MKPLIERLLTPRKEPAPYPDGWYEVVDPDKREAAEVIQQQRDLLEECERIIQVIAENDLDEPIADGGATVFDGIKQLSIATLARLRGQERG